RSGSASVPRAGRTRADLDPDSERPGDLVARDRPQRLTEFRRYTFALGLPSGFFGGLSSAFSRISAAASAPLVSGFFLIFGCASSLSTCDSHLPAKRSSCPMNAFLTYFGISETSTSYSGKWPRCV